MSESSRSSDMPLPADDDGKVSRRPESIRRGVSYLAVAAAVSILTGVGYQAVQDRESLKHSQDRLLSQIGLARTVTKRLAPGYVDADGGLVADPPTDASKLIDPDELVVAHYDGDEDDDGRVNWAGFQAYLSQKTGKKVVHQPYLNSADEVEAIKGGKIHVVALHAADTPYLVNNAGFVPVATLGSDAGASGNHLVIAVAANSPIRSLADVRGHNLTYTQPDSITGYRAAVAVLSQDAGLLPGVDYRFHFSHGQKRSIRGLVQGDFEIAALSADKIESMLADGSLKQSDYREIYASQVIPRMTIGYVYNLKPELAAPVADCILDFDNAAESDEHSAARMRFIAIDYRKDFAFPRKIDDSFDPRFGVSANLTP